MKVHINDDTVKSIRDFLEENKPESDILRIYIAGMG